MLCDFIDDFFLSKQARPKSDLVILVNLVICYSEHRILIYKKVLLQSFCGRFCVKIEELFSRYRFLNM